MYEAWENMYQDTIEGYSTPEVSEIFMNFIGRIDLSSESRLDHKVA